MSCRLRLSFFLSHSFKKTPNLQFVPWLSTEFPPPAKYKQTSQQPWPAPFQAEILCLATATTHLNGSFYSLLRYKPPSNVAHGGADHQRWRVCRVFSYHPPRREDSQQHADAVGEDVNLFSPPETLPPAGCFGTKPLLCPYHQCSVVKKKKKNPTHWMNSLNGKLCPSGRSCFPAQVAFVSWRLPGTVKLKFLLGLLWSTSPRTAKQKKVGKINIPRGKYQLPHRSSVTTHLFHNCLLINKHIIINNYSELFFFRYKKPHHPIAQGKILLLLSLLVL